MNKSGRLISATIKNSSAKVSWLLNDFMGHKKGWEQEGRVRLVPFYNKSCVPQLKVKSPEEMCSVSKSESSHKTWLWNSVVSLHKQTDCLAETRNRLGAFHSAIEQNKNQRQLKVWSHGPCAATISQALCQPDSKWFRPEVQFCLDSLRFGNVSLENAKYAPKSLKYAYRLVKEVQICDLRPLTQPGI